MSNSTPCASGSNAANNIPVILDDMSAGDQPDEPIILTLENSVIKAKKASQPTARITDIQQWTTVYSLYMSVMTHQFPGRAQELLQYVSLIHHAAQSHRGLSWCIYNHKFRCKAALNPSLDWSIIDQQIWLMIFSNGPLNQASSGGKRGGFCHEFNQAGLCSRQSCQYRHVCNRCNQSHPGYLSPSFNSKQVEVEEQTSKRGHKFSRSKHD